MNVVVVVVVAENAVSTTSESTTTATFLASEGFVVNKETVRTDAQIRAHGLSAYLSLPIIHSHGKRALTKETQQALITSLFFALVPSMAWAGDQEPVFYGGQATLAAGALSAYTEEADAAWYNPACLASINRRKVSLSGSNIALRVRSRPAILQARLDEGVVSVDDDYISMAFIPIGMAMAHSLNDRLTVGGGFYFRERDLFETQADLHLTDEGGAVLPEFPVATFGLRHQRWKLDFGLALGWQLTSRVRLGFAIFSNLFRETTDVSVNHQREESDWDSPAAEGYHLDLQLKTVSLRGFVVIGVQVMLAPRWYLGLVYRTSEASLWTLDTPTSTRAFEALEPVFGQATRRRVTGTDRGSLIELVNPALFRLALAYRGQRGWIAVEAEVAPPHRNERLGYDEDLLWNVRIGGQYSITPRFAMGGGFFTANSSLRAPDGIVNPMIDYYGITLGMSFRKEHTVRGRTEPLVFSTTMAGRCALGVGESGGLSYDPYDISAGYARGVDTETMVYDVSGYFGTSILF